MVDVWRRASYSPSFEFYSRKLCREPGGRLTPGPQAVHRSFPGTFISERVYRIMICLCTYLRIVDVYCVYAFYVQDRMFLASTRIDQGKWWSSTNCTATVSGRLINDFN